MRNWTWRRSLLVLPLLACAAGLAGAMEGSGEKTIYVSPTGSDGNPGTADQPLKTAAKAQSLAKPGMAVHFLPPQRQLYVSPTGSDDAEGTKDKPLKSVAKALEGAGPGTTVTLLPGVYPPCTIKDLSGDADNPIVVRGAAPLPLDFSQAAAMTDGGPNQALDVNPIRKALREGKFSVSKEDGLAVVEASVKNGLAVQDCSHVIVENLVVRGGGAGITVSGEDVTLRNCAAHGCGTGIHAGGKQVRLERVVAYGNQGGGIGLGCPEDGRVELVECIAWDNGRRGRQDRQSQGDGFSSGSKKIGRIHLLRCLSLNNWSDGFDFKPGDGLVFEYCLADGNGDLGYGFKDFKIWTGGTVIIRSRAAGRALFVSGMHELRDFKTGVPFPEDAGEEKPPQEAGK